MTVQEVSDALNVSCDWVLHLLMRGDLAYMEIGGEYYMDRRDVMKYKHTRDQERSEGLDQLTRLTEEMGGYDGEF